MGRVGQRRLGRAHKRRLPQHLELWLFVFQGAGALVNRSVQHSNTLFGLEQRRDNPSAEEEERRRGVRGTEEGGGRTCISILGRSPTFGDRTGPLGLQHVPWMSARNDNVVMRSLPPKTRLLMRLPVHGPGDPLRPGPPPAPLPTDMPAASSDCSIALPLPFPERICVLVRFVFGERQTAPPPPPTTNQQHTGRGSY